MKTMVSSVQSQTSHSHTGEKTVVGDTTLTSPAVTSPAIIQHTAMFKIAGSTAAIQKVNGLNSSLASFEGCWGEGGGGH